MEDIKNLEQEWRWCLVGNVVQTHEYGENHETRIGTKHFSPGTKVYCMPGNWGDGYENIVVIAKHRKSFKYIEIIMPRKHIENFRMKKVFKPAVLRFMKKHDFRVWDDSDKSKEEIQHMLTWLNSKEEQQN